MTTTVSPTSKFVEVNGLRLHYLDWGNRGAPVIATNPTPRPPWKTS